MEIQAEMASAGILARCDRPCQAGTRRIHFPHGSGTLLNASAGLRPTEGLLAVVRRLREAGYEAWAVGGAVRDRLIGEIPGDWDVATDAPPAKS